MVKHGPIVATCRDCGRDVRLAFVGVVSHRGDNRPFEDMVADPSYTLIHAANDDHDQDWGVRFLQWTNGWDEAKVRKALSEGQP